MLADVAAADREAPWTIAAASAPEGGGAPRSTRRDGADAGRAGRPDATRALFDFLWSVKLKRAGCGFRAAVLYSADCAGEALGSTPPLTIVVVAASLSALYIG